MFRYTVRTVRTSGSAGKVILELMSPNDCVYQRFLDPRCGPLKNQMWLKQQEKKYICHAVKQDFPAFARRSFTQNASDTIWPEESERMSMKAKLCLHRNHRGSCWRSSHHIHPGKQTPASSQEPLTSFLMQTGLHCFLLLPTHPPTPSFLLSETLIRGFLMMPLSCLCTSPMTGRSGFLA